MDNIKVKDWTRQQANFYFCHEFDISTYFELCLGHETIQFIFLCDELRRKDRVNDMEKF